MTTNPESVVRVRARNGGRASVYEANGWAQVYNQGLLAGSGVTEDSRASMNVLVGGSQSAPDVVVAETASHYKIGLDIVGQVPVAITAPGANTRITAIVVYTDDLAIVSEQTEVTGSPATCGLITVNGVTSASSPQPPTDSQIRQAITADGATGSQAAYAVIGLVQVAAGMENISNSMITVKKATDGIILSSMLAEAKTEPAVFSGNSASNSASYRDMTGTYTIPEDGLYELNTHVYSASAAGTSFSMSVKALLGSEVLFERTSIISTPNYAANNFASLDATLSFWAKKGDLIKLQSLVAEAKWTGRINHVSRVKRLA